jgi:hypothetical protein
MAQGKSSVGFWVLIGTLLVGGGIGAYFLLRKPKEETEEEQEVATDDSPSSSSSSSSQYVAPTPKSFTFPFKTESEGNTFRAWVIAKDPTFASSIKLDATGKLNSYVQKAWDKYGTEYSKKTPSSTPSAGSSNKNIDIIVKKASGDLTERGKLATRPAEFLQNWATALTNNKSAFRYANQIYRADTGVRVLEWNPVNAKIYSKGNAYQYQTKFGTKSNYALKKGEEIGTVGDYAFQYNTLMLYVANAPTTYKWFKASDVTKTKPKSSFDGSNDQIEFSSFDNNLDLNL